MQPNYPISNRRTAFVKHSIPFNRTILPKRFAPPGRQVYFEVFFFRVATRYHCIMARYCVGERAVLFSFVREGLSIQQWSCSKNPHTNNGQQQKNSFQSKLFHFDVRGELCFSRCQLFVNRTQPSNSVKYFFRASAVLTIQHQQPSSESAWFDGGSNTIGL